MQKLFIATFTSGALPNLTLLNFKRIGLQPDEAAALAACMSAGGLPSLTHLIIGREGIEHPDVYQHLRDACEARGVYLTEA